MVEHVRIGHRLDRVTVTRLGRSIVANAVMVAEGPPSTSSFEAESRSEDAGLGELRFGHVRQITMNRTYPVNVLTKSQFSSMISVVGANVPPVVIARSEAARQSPGFIGTNLKTTAVSLRIYTT